MAYSRYTRIAHAAIAVSITFQMFVSLAMDHPRTSRPMASPGDLLFRWHEWVGLTALAVILASWVYRFTPGGVSALVRLFPWLSGSGRLQLAKDLCNFVRLRWTHISPDDSALSGTIHGLGLLLATALAATGGALYFALGPNDTVTPTVRSIMHVHSFLSTFMWFYLGGHVAMALWHEYIGHRTLRRMFTLR